MDDVPEKKKIKTVVVSDSIESSPPENLEQTKEKKEANNPAPEQENPVKWPSVQYIESTKPSVPQNEERPRRPSLLKVSTPKEDELPKTPSLASMDSSTSLPSEDHPRKKSTLRRSASESDQLPQSSSLVLTDSSVSIIDEGRPRKKKKSKRSRSKEAKLARSSSTLLSASNESLVNDDRRKKKKKPKRSKSKEGKLSKSSSTQLTESSASIESTGRRKKRKKPRRSKSKEGSLSKSSSTQFTQTPPLPPPPPPPPPPTPVPPPPKVIVKPLVKGRVESCPGCKLDDLKDIKSFIKKDLPKYDGITFKKGKGVGPELVIFDNNNKVRERIPLQNKSRKQCNALLIEKGFKLKRDSMHSLLSEERANTSTESNMSLLS